MKLSLFTTSSLAIVAVVVSSVVGLAEHAEHNGKQSRQSQQAPLTYLQLLSSKIVATQAMETQATETLYMVLQQQLLRTLPSPPNAPIPQPHLPLEIF
jgi:hypothetical protein